MYMKQQDINILIARLKRVAKQGTDPEYVTEDAASSAKRDATINKIKSGKVYKNIIYILFHLFGIKLLAC